MGIKRVYRSELVVTGHVVAISCNKCGRSHDLADKAKSEWAFDYHEITLSGGYGDEFPTDQETIFFVVCGTCLKAWVDTFDDPEVTVPHEGSMQEAAHSETGAKLHVRNGGYAWPADEDEPSYENDPSWEGPEAAVKNGIWEHFKGGRYLVLGHTTVYATGEPLVLYMPLYGESPVTVRPLSMWEQEVDRDGTTRPRFKLIQG